MLHLTVALRTLHPERYIQGVVLTECFEERPLPILKTHSRTKCFQANSVNCSPNRTSFGNSWPSATCPSKTRCSIFIHCCKIAQSKIRHFHQNSASEKFHCAYCPRKTAEDKFCVPSHLFGMAHATPLIRDEWLDRQPFNSTRKSQTIIVYRGCLAPRHVTSQNVFGMS